MLLCKDRIGPQSEPPCVLPSIFDTLTPKHHRDKVLTYDWVLVVDCQAAACSGSLTGLNATKARLVQELVRVVPGLVICYVLYFTVREGNSTIFVLSPRFKSVIRKALTSFEREIIDGLEGLSVYDLSESFVFHAIVSQEGQLKRRWVVGFISKAVGIGIVRIFHTDFASSFVHDFNECTIVTVWCPNRFVCGILIAFRTICSFDDTVGEIFSEDHGCIVAAGKHKSMQKVPNRQDLSINKICCSASGLGCSKWHFEIGGSDVEVHFLRKLKSYYGCHHFCQWGHFSDLFLIFRLKDFLVMWVNYDVRFAWVVRLFFSRRDIFVIIGKLHCATSLHRWACFRSYGSHKLLLLGRLCCWLDVCRVHDWVHLAGDWRRSTSLLVSSCCLLINYLLNHLWRHSRSFSRRLFCLYDLLIEDRWFIFDERRLRLVWLIVYCFAIDASATWHYTESLKLVFLSGYLSSRLRLILLLFDYL